MTEPTLSTRLRAVQDQLDAANNDLATILDDARHIGLAPFRLAQLEGAMLDTKHAMRDLTELTSALKLTRPDRQL